MWTSYFKPFPSLVNPLKTNLCLVLIWYLIIIGRDEIAGCSEKAYDSLSINDARQMLLYSSDKEVIEYINEVTSVAPCFVLLHYAH